MASDDTTKVYRKEDDMYSQQGHAAIAAHDVRLDRVEADIKEMKEDIRAMREILSEARGSWKTLVLIGGACTTFGAVISWAVSHANITLK